MPRISLCVVGPCYNESEVIGLFCDQLRRVLEQEPELDWRLILVDDGSTDDTLEKLNALAAADPRIQVYSLSRNFGHRIALTAGLDMAEGDAIVVMDTDLQHPPSLLPAMLRKFREGFDVVLPARRRTAGASWARQAISDAFYWLFNRLSDVHHEPGAADFYLLSRRAAEAVRSMREYHRYTRGMVSWIGFRRCVLPYEAPERAAGRSKYNLRRLGQMAADAIFSFSTRPVRWFIRLGLAIAAGGLGYLAYILFYVIYWRRPVEGWASLMSVVLILGGVQLAFMGVLGEYVARIYEETKRRPLYLFKQRPEPSPPASERAPP